MGANFSLIVVRVINKSKRSQRSKENIDSKDDEKVQEVNHFEECFPSQSRRCTRDSAVSSDDESGMCTNVIYGTSNYNFYKFRNQKKVR